MHDFMYIVPWRIYQARCTTGYNLPSFRLSSCEQNICDVIAIPTEPQDPTKCAGGETTPLSLPMCASAAVVTWRHAGSTFRGSCFDAASLAIGPKKWWEALSYGDAYMYNKYVQKYDEHRCGATYIGASPSPSPSFLNMRIRACAYVRP